MGPSFSSKNGVRYRFYVSRALRGRKHIAGSVRRVSAPDIEGLVEDAVRETLENQKASKEAIAERIERVILKATRVRVDLKPNDPHESASTEPIDIPWTPNTRSQAPISSGPSKDEPNPKLLQAVVRAHAWVADLTNGRHSTVEQLADAANLHPKVVRQSLRLAFFAPDIMSTIISGRQPANLTLAKIPKLLPLSWPEHRQLLKSH
jgi:hypothetical protein